MMYIKKEIAGRVIAKTGACIPGLYAIVLTPKIIFDRCRNVLTTEGI